MIIGIGNDMLEMERIKKACSRETFLIRCFTDSERAQSGGNASYYGGNFCVKEAVSKALGTGFRGFEPKDIEVLRNDAGKPYVTLHGQAGIIADNMGVSDIHVSISNLKDLVSAVAVIEANC